jgi:uncharacterized protein YbjT (DUF2867 family)
MGVLVIGGTGTVGSQVVTGLASHGAAVRVLTRSAEKLRSLSAGAQGVAGDPEQPSTLPSALQGIESVVLITPMHPKETELGLNVVEAAIAAGVRRIVYMSVHGLESGLHIPHFQSKVPIESAIKSSGLAYTLVRPNNFYQNDLRLKSVITSYGIYPQPIGKVGTNRVDVRDIADAIINALTESGHDGKTYPLVGPDALTGDEVAMIYSRHLGREVRYSGDDLDVWSKHALSVLPDWMVHDIRIMFEHIQKNGLRATEEDFAEQQKVLGHAPRSFDAFVAGIAPVWKS